MPRTSLQTSVRTERRPPQPLSTRTIPIPVRLCASLHARARLLDLVAGGEAEVFISAADGSLSVRARIVLDTYSLPPASEHRRLTVDWTHGSVQSARGRVTLSRTELRLLGALLEGDGEAVPREHLVRSTWPDASSERASSSLLPVYIHSLRRRLATVGLASALQTVRRVGYRLRV